MKRPRFRPWAQGEPVAGTSTRTEPGVKHETRFRPGLKAPAEIPHPDVKRTRDGFLINGSPPVFRPLAPGNEAEKGEKKTNDEQPASNQPKKAPIGV
jgi:hypothetical protein